MQANSRHGHQFSSLSGIHPHQDNRPMDLPIQIMVHSHQSILQLSNPTTNQLLSKTRHTNGSSRRHINNLQARSPFLATNAVKIRRANAVKVGTTQINWKKAAEDLSATSTTIVISCVAPRPIPSAEAAFAWIV